MYMILARDFVLEQFKKASLLSKLLLFIVITMGMAVNKLYQKEAELRVEIVECHKNAATKVESILRERLEGLTEALKYRKVSHNADPNSSVN